MSRAQWEERVKKARIAKLRQIQMVRDQLAMKQVLESQKDRPLRQPRRVQREGKTPAQLEQLKRLAMAKKISQLRRWRDQSKQRGAPAQPPKGQLRGRMLRGPRPDQIRDKRGRMLSGPRPDQIRDKRGRMLRAPTPDQIRDKRDIRQIKVEQPRPQRRPSVQPKVKPSALLSSIRNR